jgi:hypothetical protein
MSLEILPLVLLLPHFSTLDILNLLELLKVTFESLFFDEKIKEAFQATNV